MKEKYRKIQFEVQCVDLSNEGKGVVHHEGVTGFVDNLLPEEKALVETTYRKKDVFYAKVIEFIGKSKDRVKPICPVFKSCGGCKLMHLDYNAQLEYKKNKVKECHLPLIKLHCKYKNLLKYARKTLKQKQTGKRVQKTACEF